MIHGGTRRTATATPFVHEEPRRDTENCNCNTFCPRRATEDHGELQLQHLLSTKSHGGTRRTAELQHLLSTKSHGGTRRTATATPFVHEGPRRDTENCRTATPFVHEGTRRDTENGDCNTFCPRRATEGHGELQLQHLLSTKGHGGTRRTAELQHLLSTKGRRDTENCNCNTFCPRRDAEGHGERRLQHLLSTNGGTRRTATATPFVHEEPRRPRRDTENCNCNTFCPRRATEDHGELQLQHLLSTKGHGGTRRTATATPFVHEGPRRTGNTATPFGRTEGHGELLQHLLSTKGHGGPRRTATATPFVHEGTRRDTENGNCNTFCPRRATEGHGELQLQHLLSTKGHATEDHGELQLQHLLSTKGRGGTGRTATATPFVHEGMRGTTKKNFFCPRWAAKNSFLIHEGL